MQDLENLATLLDKANYYPQGERLKLMILLAIAEQLEDLVRAVRDSALDRDY